MAITDFGPAVVNEDGTGIGTDVDASHINALRTAVNGVESRLDTGLLVAEILVTGSAVTSVSFAGLDGNAHGGYFLEAFIYNSAAIADYKMYVENDTTDTDYQGAFVSGSTAGSVGNGYAKPVLSNQGAGIIAAIYADIQIISGWYSVIASSYRHDGYSILWGFRKNAVIANITRLDIVASAASAIGIGSRFRLFRRL